jgi:plastocyanin
MGGKIQSGPAARRILALAGLAVASLGWVARPAVVSGRVTMLDKEDRPADDVGQAVLWLDGPAAGPRPPVETEIGTSKKEFSPHVLVVPVGSTVAFPNHDPVNHNVFSLSEENPFDLGLYGRGEVRSARFERPGVVRIYCNVHAQMSAIVVVRDTPWYTQPASDGSFSFGAVPPGGYTLHAWHERAQAIARALDVPAEGLEQLAVELDARGFQFKPHLNKHGQPYPQQGRRY